MPRPSTRLDRRSFLGAGGAAIICTIGGERISLSKPGDAAKADAMARRLKRPKGQATARAAQAGNPNAGDFPRPVPAPGGVIREYWIEARTTLWNVVPRHRDEWHDRAVRGRTAFRAYVYQQMTPGFASPIGAAAMPGPTLYAEVGDVLEVHFRNADETLDQAVTMHPHGVRYNPDYDGAYMGDFTRAGGFIAPGEEFTYRWEATPDSVGVWPYHDHGPNHMLNTFRGLFGTIIIRPKGAKVPDVEHVLHLHQLTPPVTGIQRQFQCINGRAYPGNTPTIKAKVGQDVAIHVIGMDGNFHDFHIHGHRWKDPSGTFVDTPSLGPNESITARFTEDNPGRWLYHCHVFSHQDNGMAGWYDVTA